MDFLATIEIPKNSCYKFEASKPDFKTLNLDRVLPIPCPYNYGFLKNGPISADGDPLDIFIVSGEPIPPMTIVKFKVWGILICEDNGVEDNKVIATIENDIFRDYDYFRKIKFYLENYKEGFKILDYKIFNDDTLFKNFIESNNLTHSN